MNANETSVTKRELYRALETKEAFGHVQHGLRAVASTLDSRAQDDGIPGAETKFS